MSPTDSTVAKSQMDPQVAKNQIESPVVKSQIEVPISKLIPQPIWDAHCHLSDLRIFDDRALVLKQAINQGWGGFFLGGYEPAEWSRQLQLKREFALEGVEVRTSFGLHPWWVSETSEVKLEEAFGDLETQIALGDAVGETGLDFQPRFDDHMKAAQTLYFERTLELRDQSSKIYQREFPLVLHVVRAHPEALKILNSVNLGTIPGLVHSFSGDWGAARKYLDLGFLISISGAFLRPGGDRLVETIQKVPLDRLTLETDSPDQPPDNFHSQILPGKNDPSSILLLAAAIAEVRGETSQKILEASADNVIKLFARGS
jgi:TatD DNase family protein